MYLHVSRDIRYFRCSAYDNRRCASGGKPALAQDKITGGRPRVNGKFAPMDDEARAQLSRKPGVERWAWECVENVLRDPSIIAAELEHRRNEGTDPALLANLDIVRRARAKLERQQQRLLALYAADDDALPFDAIKQLLAATEREKVQYQSSIADIEHRLTEQRLASDQLQQLSAYCERVGRNLESFGFQEKRLALEALGVRVHASGRDWRLEAAIPLSSDAVVVTTSSR
jgi:hypothetical protein